MIKTQHTLYIEEGVTFIALPIFFIMFAVFYKSYSWNNADTGVGR